jgi:hypothetical protein
VGKRFYTLSYILLKMIRRLFHKKSRIVAPILVISLVLVATTAGTSIFLAQRVGAAVSLTIGGPTLDQINNGVISALFAPTFNSQYSLVSNGTSIPIKYTILQGSLVGMLSDPTRHSVDLAVNPGPNGGAIAVNMPRHVVDSKTSAGQDQPFAVVMDGNRISGEPQGICVGTCPNIFNTFKEIHSTNTDRTLLVIFGPESRFIEIHGNAGL